LECPGAGLDEEMKMKEKRKTMYYEAVAWRFCLAFGVRWADDELPLAYDIWVATKFA